MKLFWKVEIFFKVLGRSLSRNTFQLIAEMKSKLINEFNIQEKIKLTDLFFFEVRSSGLTLMSFGAGGSEVVQSMKLSVDEARLVFLSIKQACADQDIVSVKLGEQSWTTDARPKSDPDNIVVKCSGPWMRTRDIATREDVAKAMTQFVDRVGLK
jgi:hypothetical protein